MPADPAHQQVPAGEPEPAARVLPTPTSVPATSTTMPTTTTATAYDGALPRPPRRRGAAPAEGGPLRAVAGAGVAVVGVLLGVGALLWMSEDPQSGNPVVAAVPAPADVAPGGAPPVPGPLATPPPRVSPAAPAPPAPPTPQAPPVAVPGTPRPVAVPGTPRPVAVPATPRPAAPAPGPPLTVLNNSRYHDLAERAAARFRGGGWPVAVTGQFTGRLRASTVYYSPGQRAVAQRLAARFGLPRVLPRFAGLPGQGLTVVVTRDYA